MKTSQTTLAQEDSTSRRMNEPRFMIHLWVALAVSLLYFLVLIVFSHITHALTLLVSAYQVLCSVVALVGYMLTIQHTGRGLTQPIEDDKDQKQPEIHPNEELKALSLGPTGLPRYLTSKERRATRLLMNTFGWARIDLLFLLVGCVFLASLCFSVLVEALQTLIHISHHDEMHHPITVLALGAIGLLNNIFSYMMVGSFMYQEGTILRLTKTGEVVLEAIAEKAVAAEIEAKNLSFIRKNFWLRLMRDNIGSIFVLFCGVLVNFAQENVAKFIDPVFSIISTVSLLALNFPYMKESCLILLQTIPNHINIDSLKREVLATYPQIINVHDFHIWQLNEEKVVLTVHMVFSKTEEYERIHGEVTTFFNNNGITHTTIQPEFLNDYFGTSSSLQCPLDGCLVRCTTKECLEAVCCSFEGYLEAIAVSETEQLQEKPKDNQDLNEAEVIEKSQEKEESLEGPNKEGNLVIIKNQSTKTEDNDE